MIMLDYNMARPSTVQITGWNFNSMVKFGQHYLGASEDGLFSLEGDTDNGEDIESIIEPLTTDFDHNGDKRVRFMYFGLEADGEMEVDLLVNEELAETIEIPTEVTGQQEIRVPAPQAIQGAYWGFQVRNIGGCDFSLDKIKLLLIKLHPGYAR